MALESNNAVSVIETEDEFVFIPSRTNKSIEVIFFQGGLTDPKAYAPLCRNIAQNGFRYQLIKMAWRLPLYDYRKVESLLDLKSRRFVIDGHSQGAKMAAHIYLRNGQFTERIISFRHVTSTGYRSIEFGNSHFKGVCRA